MTEDDSTSKWSFVRRIDRTDWVRHLNSHYLLICELKRFLEPWNLSLFVDRFMGMLRSFCFEKAGSKSSIEELKISLKSSDKFYVELLFGNSQEQFCEKLIISISDILAWPVINEPFLRTQRLEIGLLLPSDEPEIIDILKDPAVWKMRGDRYSPLVNIHSTYPYSKHELPWYKYYFVIRLCKSKKIIGFIGFSQISQPGAISPVISQIPYKSVLLSYGLSMQYWGKELMSESLFACIPWFVASQNLHQLVAFVEINNLGSRRLLQKLGFKEYGLLENPMISPDLKDIYKFMIYKKLT